MVEQEDLYSRMEEAWQVVDRPFTSDVPMIGPLIAFVRERWSRVAAKWYMLKLQEQQNRFNRLVLELAHQVTEMQVRSDMQTTEMQARSDMLDQLIAQQADLVADRGLSISCLAERVSRLGMRVEELEAPVEESARNDAT